jgi:dimeric dUTPase (all-alpha-NTP-PPase superfamily)
MTTDRMQQMLDMQRDLQLRINAGHTIEAHTPEEKMEAFRTNVLACTDELHEALDETGWKPWATSNHLNRDAFHSEMVDAWHFFMNLMLHGEMSMDDLYRGYMAKNAVNHRRQIDGYDGVKGKCQTCHRDLADRGVTCTFDWCASEQDHKQTMVVYDDVAAVRAPDLADTRLDLLAPTADWATRWNDQHLLGEYPPIVPGAESPHA